MFELSDFYEYCKENQVDVIPFTGCPKPGATIRDHGDYAIFLDFSQIHSTQLLRGICFHELGHVATGALHSIDSPYELVERSEYRAKRWGAERYLTPDVFRTAFADGCQELWELSDYFELPEDVVADAYNYWTQQKGITFEK